MADDKYDLNRIRLGLYTDLDTIYDTRLATLELVHPKLPRLAIEQGYFERKQDIFPMVSKENFEKLYANRNTETLELALPSKAMHFIPHFVKTAFPESINNPWNEEVAIYVNVYPYKIDKNTARRMLEPLSKLTAGGAVVNMLNIPTKSLTLRYCQNTFGAMMVYDYQNWLDEVSKTGEFNKVAIPNVVLIAPKLYEKLPTDEELRSMKKSNTDPFKAVEIAASAKIGLQYVDIDEFSADLPAGFFEEYKHDSNDASA